MKFPMSKTTFASKVRAAAKMYWQTRESQASRQKDTGKKDAGTRGQVTGGKQLDAFANLVKDTGLLAGFRENEIYFNSSAPIPGYYRPQKNWDVVFVRNGRLVAAVELKSQSGSFGNNFNNRTEEVLGVSHDFWKAFRERAFGVVEPPWIGYLFFLEDSPASRNEISLKSSPFPPMEDFGGTSYLKRYEILCERLMLERDYSATALIVSEKGGRKVRDGGANVTAYAFFTSLYSFLVART